jgi:hypothetical protein
VPICIHFRMMDKNGNTDEVPRGTIIGALMYSDLNTLNNKKWLATGTFYSIGSVCLINLGAYVRTSSEPRF